MEVSRLLESLGEPRWKGAESYLYIIEWLGRPAVLKLRLPKTYRHPVIDAELRWSRTVTESRALLAARRAGIPVPRLLYVDPPCYIIVTEYVEGKLLSSIISENPREAIAYAEALGEHVGLLHERGIGHGDLTTSNVIVSPRREVYLIDFGLSTLKASERDYAIDVHLYLRSLESTHPSHVKKLLESFMKGYSRVRGKSEADRVLKLVKEIRLMGRYVAERRTAWSTQ